LNPVSVDSYASPADLAIDSNIMEDTIEFAKVPESSEPDNFARSIIHQPSRLPI
jgi:hypothetical protein